MDTSERPVRYYYHERNNSQWIVGLDLLHEDQFSVELVVQCIRTSKSPQTHQHALLLLNIAAQLFPVLIHFIQGTVIQCLECFVQESVVHKIMPIFTFMGASLLRMDDSYSMQIVKKTVETVVPAVMKVGTSVYGMCRDSLDRMYFISRLYNFC